MIFNGRFLKEARQAKKLTQKQLGELVGVSGVAIMRYENNQRKPSDDIFFDLARVLECPTVTLATGLTPTEWEAIDPEVQEIIATNNRSAQIVTDTLSDAKKIEWSEMTSDEILKNSPYAKLMWSFSKLNEDGQTVAVDRVEELTQIPKYQRTEPPEEEKEGEYTTKEEKPPEGL